MSACNGDDVYHGMRTYRWPSIPLALNRTIFVTFSTRIYSNLPSVVTALLLAILEVVPPIVLTTQYGMPPSATAVLFGIVSAVVLAVFAVTAAIGSRISRRGLMCVGVASIFAGGLWAEFGWTTGAKLWEFIGPFCILATAPAPLIRTPARAVYTSHLPISIQGVMQGISESAFSLANFLGPILGSYVAEEGSVFALQHGN
eukprot:s148_g31.t1